MAKMVLIEEFHVTVLIPHGLPEPNCRAIRQALVGRAFRTDLGRAVRQAFGRYPVLRKVRVRVSR